MTEIFMPKAGMDMKEGRLIRWLKEIGDHVSISFYANNFTNSRPFVASYATGVKAVFTPDFYYGLTVRLKF